ncbi:MAG: RHS repeat protein [Actinomycetia bacterium]|nr:RHS repeat protein [Actinomycetes bacterium]
MAYDGDGDLISIADPLSNTIHLSYNSRGDLKQFKDARGGINLYDYDINGNLVSRRDAAGNEMVFIYDSLGQLQSVTDALGHVTTMTYDNAGHLIRKVEADGSETVIDVDAVGKPVRVTTTRTTPSGIVTEIAELVYDQLGRLIERRHPDGSVARLIYGDLDKVEATIDRLGRRRDLTYDLMGRLSAITYADGTTEQRGHDAEGRLATFADRAGRVSTFSYDAEGQLTGVIRPDGTSVARAFDAAGRLTSEISARGGVITHTYDAAGRRIGVADALGNTTAFTYDADGSPVAVEDPNGTVTSFAYDNLGRRIRTILPDGTSRAVTYDALGRLTSETDPGGGTTQHAYDPMGRLVAVTDALGGVTQMAYDERGNRTTLTDGNGHVTRFEHDALGRLIRRILPDGATETFTYDAEGNRTSHTDVSGRVTTWRYDANNRAVEKTLHDGSAVTFTYTANGRLETMADARGVTTYAYDDRDRLIELDDASGGRLTYSYDTDGNRTSLTALVGGIAQTTSYGYDLAGRLTTVVDPEAGTYDYAYDANGTLQSLTYPNGVRTDHVFDALDRLMGLTVTSPAGTVLHSEAYQRNASGSRTRITEHDGTVRTYGYDLLQRLTQETVSDDTTVQLDQQLLYDAVGNRVQDTRTNASGTATTLYTYDACDRLQSAGATSYTWDANGNLLSRDDGTRVDFTWDTEDRLATGTVAGGVTKTFAYGGQGRRVGISATDTSGKVERRLLVDPSESLSHVVVESDEADASQSTLVRGVSLLAVLRPSGTEYQHTDGLGTIRLRTDAAGAVIGRHAYRAFGEPLQPPAASDGYRFAGEPYDADLGIAYHRARWLDPNVGRFMSRDPFPGFARQPGTLHRYAYVQNDPLNRIDPTGLLGAQGVLGLAVGLTVLATITLSSLTTFGAFETAAIAGESVDGLIVSGRVNAAARGISLGGGADVVLDFDSGKPWVGLTAEFGLSPLSVFPKHTPSFGRGGTAGFIVNMDSPRELTGRGSTATWPISVLRLMPASLFNGNKAWGLLSQLAKRVKGGSGSTVSFGFSTSGPSMFQIGMRSNDFAALATYSGEFVPYDELPDVAREVFDDLVSFAMSLEYIGPEMTKIINNAPAWFEAVSRGYPCTSGCD